MQLYPGIPYRCISRGLMSVAVFYFPQHIYYIQYDNRSTFQNIPYQQERPKETRTPVLRAAQQHPPTTSLAAAQQMTASTVIISCWRRPQTHPLNTLHTSLFFFYWLPPGWSVLVGVLLVVVVVCSGVHVVSLSVHAQLPDSRILYSGVVALT